MPRQRRAVAVNPGHVLQRGLSCWACSSISAGHVQRAHGRAARSQAAGQPARARSRSRPRRRRTRSGRRPCRAGWPGPPRPGTRTDRCRDSSKSTRLSTKKYAFSAARSSQKLGHLVPGAHARVDRTGSVAPGREFRVPRVTERASAAAPEVSVIVPAHDAEDTLPRLLAALDASTFEGSREVIVVDDASRDATAELAAAGGAPRVVRARGPGRSRSTRATPALRPPGRR